MVTNCSPRSTSLYETNFKDIHDVVNVRSSDFGKSL